MSQIITHIAGSRYDPLNWYWRKADGTIYSSAAQGVVSDTDPAYVAFLAGGSHPTPYPRDTAGQESEAELAAVLAPYGLYVSAAAARRAEILARLAEIDAASVRPMRAIADGTAVQADHDKLAALDSEAAGLREELAGLG
jgi:hypothetical protein